MSDSERRFIDDRTTRNAARSLFDTRLAQIKGDLAARGIGGRLADKAKADALALAQESLAVAKESKGIIAATAGALLLWAFRNPIRDALTGHGELADPGTETDEEDYDSE